MPKPEPRLDQVQRWMQSVLMHPGGVSEGVDAPGARAEIDITLRDLPEVILPSQALSSANRLEIYVNAYRARLMECLDEEFAVTRWTLGEDLFGAVTFGYLESYPSRSYTLGQLGASFPQYLAESRLHAAEMPSGAEPTWPEFVVELATLERALYEVYDGPGTERSGSLDPAELAAVEPEAWGELRLVPAQCLRLLALSHDVSTYWGERKDDGNPRPGDSRPFWLALCRQDFVVERHELSSAQFDLLSAIAAGQPLVEAIAVASAGAGDGLLESQLGTWFAEWMESGFFSGLASDG